MSTELAKENYGFEKIFGEKRTLKEGSQKKTAKKVVNYFNPKSLLFWQALILSFCLCAWLGHLLEIPYCATMDHFFGIVEEDYAVRTDPFFFPYHVYGFGALAMTFLIEPIKEFLCARREKFWVALLEMFVLTVILSAFLETAMGFIINVPDAAGVYPCWDNSVLPGNILGQGWIVNDVFIGLAAMVYIWVIFPLVNKLLSSVGKSNAKMITIAVVIVFAICAITAQLFEFGIIAF